MSPASTRFLTVAVVAGLVLSACGGSAAATVAPATEAPSAATAPSTSAAPASPAEVVFPAPEVASITIANAVPTEALGFAPQLAVVKGYFTKLGITAKVVGFDGGDSAAIQALTAGQAQFAFAGPGVLNTLGTDAPAVGLAYSALRVDDGLFCKSSIKTAADLKGAQIAISTFGGASNASVLLALKALNVPASDVTIKQVGGQGARIAALKGGSIDCAPVQDAQGQAKLPGFNMVVDLATVATARLPVEGLLVTKDFMAKNPNTVLDVVAALLEGENSMWTDTAGAITAFAADQQISEADATPLIQNYINLAPRSMATVASDWDIAITLYHQNKPDAPSADPNSVFDMSVLQKLRDMGWYAQIGDPALP